MTVETARQLRAEGFPARFVELGEVGHTFVAGAGGEVWRDALAWVAGGDDGPARGLVTSARPESVSLSRSSEKSSSTP